MGQLVQQIPVKPVYITVRGPYYEPSFMGWGWGLGKWFMGHFMSLPALGLLMYFFFFFVPLLHRSPGKQGPKVSDEHNRAIQRYVRLFFASFMGYGWVLGKWFMGPFRSLLTLGLLMFFFILYGYFTEVLESKDQK